MKHERAGFRLGNERNGHGAAHGVTPERQAAVPHWCEVSARRNRPAMLADGTRSRESVSATDAAQEYRCMSDAKSHGAAFIAARGQSGGRSVARRACWPGRLTATTGIVQGLQIQTRDLAYPSSMKTGRICRCKSLCGHNVPHAGVERVSRRFRRAVLSSRARRHGKCNAIPAWIRSDGLSGPVPAAILDGVTQLGAKPSHSGGTNGCHRAGTICTISSGRSRRRLGNGSRFLSFWES